MVEEALRERGADSTGEWSGELKASGIFSASDETAVGLLSGAGFFAELPLEPIASPKPIPEAVP